MGAQSTTAASRPGTWVASRGWRTCYRCGSMIREGDAHIAFGAHFDRHQCNGCTDETVTLLRRSRGMLP